MPAVPEPVGLFDVNSVITRDIFKLARKLSGADQLMAILYIAGETALIDPEHPDVVPPEYAPLTFADFSARLGCPVSQVISALTDAENRGLIESLDPQEAKRRGFETVGPAGPIQGRWYRLRPENWARAANWASRMGGSGR